MQVVVAKEPGYTVVIVVGDNGCSLSLHLVHGIFGSVATVGQTEERQVVEVVAKGHDLPGVELVDYLLGRGRFGDSQRVNFEIAVAGIDNIAIAKEAAFARPVYFGSGGLEAVEEVDDQDEEGWSFEQGRAIVVDEHEVLIGSVLALAFELALHVVGKWLVKDLQFVVVDAIDKGHQVALLELLDILQGRVVGKSVGTDVASAADVVEYGPVHEYGRQVEIELLQQRYDRGRRACRGYGKAHPLLQQIVENLGREG